MKRILIFSVAYYPKFVGGAEVAVKEITDRISDYSFDMITLNLDGASPAQEKIGNVTVYRVGGPSKWHKLLFPFIVSYKAARLHKSNPYDATWSIMASFSGFAALFFNFRHPRIPFILTLQEGDPISYIKQKVWWVWPLFKQIFRRATKIQAISDHLKKFAQSMNAKPQVEVIPNGVDLKLFSKIFSPPQRISIRKKWGANQSDTVLITTSRLVHKNGVGDIIQALTFLPEQVKLVIVGIGPFEEQLKMLVQTQHLDHRVFFEGFITYETIPQFLAGADIFVRPSLSEGMGNSFIEAMAAGLPIIGTNVGGIPDFLKDRQTGLFCNVQDPKNVAEKIDELMSDKPLYEKLKRQGRKIAQYYDWDLIAEAMSNLIFGS